MRLRKELSSGEEPNHEQVVGGKDKLRTLRDKMRCERRRVIEYLERKNMDEIIDCQFWRNVDLEIDRKMTPWVPFGWLTWWSGGQW